MEIFHDFYHEASNTPPPPRLMAIFSIHSFSLLFFFCNWILYIWNGFYTFTLHSPPNYDIYITQSPKYVQNTSLRLGNDSKWFLNIFWNPNGTRDNDDIGDDDYTILCRWSEWMWERGRAVTGLWAGLWFYLHQIRQLCKLWHCRQLGF